MIARGKGLPVAVIPGIQGRWEWMAPTIDALAEGHRVLTGSLTDLRPERRADGSFLDWLPAIDDMLDRAGERRVALVGVSFGGLIAACYAAHRPERVSALILVSAPAPVWTLRRGDAFCIRFPRLSFPYFATRALRRLGPEIYHARPTWPERITLTREYVQRSVSAPFSPGYAAQWVREWHAADLTTDCARITAPTLVVTGDPAIERVVPVDRTLEYLRLIPGARHAELHGTGHIGVITKPGAFLDVAAPFIAAAQAPADGRDRRHAS
jgi:pimeloyl-ACP methyl ester carboxylesterase